MTVGDPLDRSSSEPIDYEKLVDLFQRALIHTLRKHSVADSFLDFWVPDADPVLGIAGMVDSARIGGLPAIAIRFRLATLPRERLAELEQALAGLCSVRFEIADDAVLLHATEMRKSAQSAKAARAARPGRTTWSPPAGESGKSPSPAAARWEGGELPEFGDVHPRFRLPLQAACATLACEGETGPPQDGAVRAAGKVESIALMLDVDPATHIVRAARHAGAPAPSARAVLDLFCRAARGLPVQEAADHLCLKVIESLVDPGKGPPVGGVLMPANAGAPFLLASRLARLAYDDYRARTGAASGVNFYCPPPSGAWQALSPEERRSRADAVLQAYLGAQGLGTGDMRILGIQKNKYGHMVRVVVALSDRLDAARKPALMRGLERRLRAELEPELDLVADRAKDTSPLRRLS